MIRAGLVAALIALPALPVAAKSEPPGIGPSEEAQRNQARWADLEAQARMTDGDYDGAVQAEKQAKASRDEAAKRQPAARAVKRP